MLTFVMHQPRTPLCTLLCQIPPAGPKAIGGSDVSMKE